MSVQRIFAIVLRHLYVWPRGIERFMWSVGWPLIELLIWGLTTAYLQKNTTFPFSFTAVILGAIIFWGIATRCQLEMTVNFLEEMWNKNIMNIFSTPLRVTEFLIASIILGLIKFLFTASLLILVAYIGYQFNLFQFGWYLPLLVFNLMVFGWVFSFFVTGLIVNFGRSIEEFAWSGIFFLQPFMCVFYPLSSLPAWAQAVGRIFPPTYVFEELRRYFFTGEILLENIGLSMILNVFYLFFSISFLYWMLDRARETGRLTKLDEFF